MPQGNDCKTIVIPDGLRTEETEGEKHLRAHIPRDEAKHLVWLPWKSNNQEHGLIRHKFNQDGSIKEIGDLGPVISRRKPKAVSSRQYEGRC